MAEWTPELAFSDEDVAIGLAGPVIADVWTRHVTVRALQRLQRVITERGAHAPLAIVTVIEPTATVPDHAARDMAAAFLDAVAEHIAVSALVLEGAAMQSAAFRGVDAGFTMLGKRDYPHEAFESMSAAAEWLAEQAPSRWGASAERFETIIDDLRRRQR